LATVPFPQKTSHDTRPPVHKHLTTVVQINSD